MSAIKLSVFLIICVSVWGKPAQRIRDGEEVWDVPYQAAIQIHFLLMLCGGVIIDAIHVLTSAHCVIDMNGRAILSSSSRIMIGVTDYLNFTNENVYSIAGAKIHEEYNASDSYHHDIAILKLDRAISFTKKQSPVPLPTNDTTEGTWVMSTGWGALRYNRSTDRAGPYPRVLRKSLENVISQEQCQDMMKDETIYPEHICAKSLSGTSVCYGDSGGPLVAADSLVGLASFNEYCNPAYPTVYTRVYKYLDWIKKATNQV